MSYFFIKYFTVNLFYYLLRILKFVSFVRILFSITLINIQVNIWIFNIVLVFKKFLAFFWSIMGDKIEMLIVKKSICSKLQHCTVRNYFIVSLSQRLNAWIHKILDAYRDLCYKNILLLNIEKQNTSTLHKEEPLQKV